MRVNTVPNFSVIFSSDWNILEVPKSITLIVLSKSSLSNNKFSGFKSLENEINTKLPMHNFLSMTINDCTEHLTHNMRCFGLRKALELYNFLKEFPASTISTL